MHRNLMRAASFAAVLLSPVAMAEAAPASSSIPNITISKASPSAPVGSSLFNEAVNPDSGSLTGESVNNAAQTLSRVPGSVDLVPSENYRDSYAQNFKDMLGDTPGVFAEKRYGEEVRLSIRGSGLSRNFHLRGIRLLQDGIPYTLADGSGDFMEIDPLISRYTEVYKGGNGLRYGAATLGGAINIVTPTGHTATSPNLLRVEGGSFGTARLHGSMARAYEKLDFYGALTTVRSDGYRDQSSQIHGRFNTNVGYKLSDTAETRFYLTYNNLNQQVPGTLTLKQALETPEMAPASNIYNDNARDIRSIHFANKTTLLVNNGDKLDVGGSLAFRSLFHPIFQVLDQEQANYTGFTRLTGRGAIGGYRNDYILGANIEHGNIDARQYVNVLGSRGTLTASSDQQAANYDIYGENQFFVMPDVALITGGQFLYATRDYRDRLRAVNNAATDYAAFNPKFGALWDITRQTQLFGNVSRSYEPPTFSELVQTGVAGFVPLKAQDGWTAEFGTRGAFDRFAWDATYYHSWLENELLSYTTGPNIPAATFNAGSTRHRGIELGFDTDLARDWLFAPASAHQLFLRQTYAYNDFAFKNDVQYGNNKIAGVPKHLYRAELRYENKGGWHIAPHMEWAPEGGFVDHANTLQAPGYVTFGLGAGYAINEGTRLYVDARNLTDERYVSNFNTINDARKTSTAVFYPGEGRSVFVGMSYSF